MKIQYVTTQVPTKWRHYQKYLKPIFETTFAQTKTDSHKDEVSIILVMDEQMHELNQNFRHIDRPTDVLTFIDEDDENYLGDVFINVDAVFRQANDYGHTLKREFCFLVTHGALHLLGYDHQNPDEEKEMFTLQEEILRDIAPKKK